MNNKKQSSVKWLYKELSNIDKDLRNNIMSVDAYNTKKYEALQHAKALHKQETIDNWLKGLSLVANNSSDFRSDAERYYIQTYETDN